MAAFIQFTPTMGSPVRTETYVMNRAVPTIARRVGKLLGGGDVRYIISDPVWTFDVDLFRLPFAAVQRLLLMGGTRVGVDIVDEDLSSASESADPDRPHAEVWWNASMQARFLVAEPRLLGADVLRGSTWRVKFTTRESEIQSRLAPTRISGTLTFGVATAYDREDAGRGTLTLGAPTWEDREDAGRGTLTLGAPAWEDREDAGRGTLTLGAPAWEDREDAGRGTLTLGVPTFGHSAS